MITIALAYTLFCVLLASVIIMSLIKEQLNLFSFFGIMTIILILTGGLVFSANLFNLIVYDNIDVRRSLDQNQDYYILHISENSNVLMMRQQDVFKRKLIGPEFLYKHKKELPEEMKAGDTVRYISGEFHLHGNFHK